MVLLRDLVLLSRKTQYIQPSLPEKILIFLRGESLLLYVFRECGG